MFSYSCLNFSPIARPYPVSQHSHSQSPHCPSPGICSLCSSVCPFPFFSLLSPTSSRLVSVLCSLFPSLWFYFDHLFVLLIRFHLHYLINNGQLQAPPNSYFYLLNNTPFLFKTTSHSFLLVILLDVANCIPCFPWMLGVSLTMSYIAAWWIFIWVKFETKVVLNMTSLRVGVWYRCIPCIPRLYQLQEKPNAWTLTWELDVFRATLLSAFIMRILRHSRNFCTSNVVEHSQPY